MSSGGSAASPAGKKGTGKQQASAPSTASAVPSRPVSFVTVGASGYSQLFATNCLPSLFLAAVASELTHHIAQRLQANLSALSTQQQQHTASQPQPQPQPQPTGEFSSEAVEEKEQLTTPAATTADPAFELQLQQWQTEQQQLADRQLQYEAALDVLSHTTDDECTFDVRDTTSGTALMLFEQRDTRVKDVLTGAGKYELLVAQKKQDAANLTFHPLQLPV